MCMPKFKTGAAALLAVIAAGAGVLTQSLAAEKPAVSSAKEEKKYQTGLTAAEFATLHKELQFKNAPWATLPWQLSVTEARHLAAKEKKPILLINGNGHLLCAG